jgi:predicted ATPase
VRLEFHPLITVVCGPNNSGKTTILSAVFWLSKLLSINFNMQFQRTPTFSLARAVLSTAPSLTEDLFNLYAGDECLLEAEIAYPRDSLKFQPANSGDSVPIRFGVSVNRTGQTLRTLQVGGEQTLDFGKGAVKLQGIPGDWTAPLSQWLQTLPVAANRMLYFGSHRGFGPRVNQSPDDLYGMAIGAGVIPWVQRARQPNLQDATSKKHNALLKEFESDFARFAGFESFELSVPPAADELNAHVNGRAMPISRMGAGIGECLLIMLVTKLAKSLPALRGAPPIDVVLIEEPELHLHPHLQRLLLDFLIRYAKEGDTQLILSTHSPTVLNVVQREGGTIYRTAWDGDRNEIAVSAASTTDELLAILQSIGASPGDLLQAEKVLWVEGPHDIPAFRAWLSKAPSFQNQVVAVVSIGGDSSASDDFDVAQLKALNPKALVVLDSERDTAGGAPAPARSKFLAKCGAAGVACSLTDLRSTESYFSARALATIYPGVPSVLDQYKTLGDQLPAYRKSDCGKIAAAMDWSEIASTDIGRLIEEFLRS